MGFEYAEDVFGPEAENRTLDSIRKSLRDPDCTGPETVYSVAMDVGKKKHRQILKCSVPIFKPKQTFSDLSVFNLYIFSVFLYITNVKG